MSEGAEASNKGKKKEDSHNSSASEEAGDGEDTDWPHYDIAETDTRIIIHADLPGVNDEDVRAEFFDNKLVIKGSRNTKLDGVKYHSKGRHHDVFQRTIVIPVPVQKHTVKATFRHGIMEVKVKKEDPEKRNKKISFTFASSSAKGDKEKEKDKENASE
eukprot:Phypoly_transcript_17815.p1 GENE.Phypoly_transcript_17815~~Phypoly_transcript_17815.p1  ORF type:complete len:159 (+),score=40.51 Phypoly_transcript_17815:275-751(+)